MTVNSVRTYNIALFVLILNAIAFAKLNPLPNSACKLYDLKVNPIAGMDFKFDFQLGFPAQKQPNRMTAAFRGDAHNRPVTVIDFGSEKKPGKGSFTAPAVSGDYVLGVIAVRDPVGNEDGLYQSCVIKIHVNDVKSLSENYDSSQITKRNRYHDQSSDNNGIGQMGGGWGTHLRSLYYSNDGTKWFVHERPGPTVMQNPGLEYERYDEKSGWKLSGVQAIPTGIQQNMAHIADGTTIYSYGVRVLQSPRELFECTFDMKTRKSGGCRTIPNAGVHQSQWSNYVGAAIVPEGRLVWFTSDIKPQDTPDEFKKYGWGSYTYVFNDGNGWKPYQKTGLGLYDQLNYIRSNNAGDGIQVIGGELEHGGHGYAGPVVAQHLLGSRYATQIGTINYKTKTGTSLPARLSKVMYKGVSDEGATDVIEDVFVDQNSKRVHVLVRLFTAPTPDRIDKNGKKLIQCAYYETEEAKYKGLTYGEFQKPQYDEQRRILNQKGDDCIKAVRKNQMGQDGLYGYRPTLAYGSISLADLISGKPIHVMPQVQLADGGDARFIYNGKTQELNVVMSRREKSDSGTMTYFLRNYTFAKAALSVPLEFNTARTRAFDLATIEARENFPNGSVNDLAKNGPYTIYVPGANYTPAGYLSSDLELALCGSGYNYGTDGTRSDGRVFHMILPY